MYHPHDYHDLTSGTLYRNTIKTCTASSESTHLTEDPRYRPGTTAHSRPVHRQPPPHVRYDESHSHPRSQHRPRAPKARPHHFHNREHDKADSPYTSGELPVTAYVGRLSKEQFIDVLSMDLDRKAEYNCDFVALPTYSEPESVFFSVSRPDIPTKDYITRLVTYTQCSPSAFVVMLIYLDRIAESNRRLLVTPYNMHRLLVTALTLACKVLDDRCFSNVHYAKVGGIPTAREMNRLELQFLSYLDYRLHVRKEAYVRKERYLESQPPPNSPVSVALDRMSPVTATSSLDKDELQSMISVESGTGLSMRTDHRYCTRTDSNMNALVHAHTYPKPTMRHAPVNGDNWYASQNTYPPPPGGKHGRKELRQRQDLHMQQMINDIVP